MEKKYSITTTQDIQGVIQKVTIGTLGVFTYNANGKYVKIAYFDDINDTHSYSKASVMSVEDVKTLIDSVKEAINNSTAYLNITDTPDIFIEREKVYTNAMYYITEIFNFMNKDISEDDAKNFLVDLKKPTSKVATKLIGSMIGIKKIAKGADSLIYEIETYPGDDVSKYSLTWSFNPNDPTALTRGLKKILSNASIKEPNDFFSLPLDDKVAIAETMVIAFRQEDIFEDAVEIHRSDKLAIASIRDNCLKVLNLATYTEVVDKDIVIESDVLTLEQYNIFIENGCKQKFAYVKDEASGFSLIILELITLVVAGNGAKVLSLSSVTHKFTRFDLISYSNINIALHEIIERTKLKLSEVDKYTMKLTKALGYLYYPEKFVAPESNPDDTIRIKDLGLKD